MEFLHDLSLAEIESLMIACNSLESHPSEIDAAIAQALLSECRKEVLRRLEGKQREELLKSFAEAILRGDI